MCKESIPIDKENAWKYPKLHELLHILDDMSCFGSPLNFCVQGPEALLKDAGKCCGRWAQKRNDISVYELQSAQHLMNCVVIDTVHTSIWDTEDRENRALKTAMMSLLTPMQFSKEQKKPHVDVFVESNQATKCSMKSSGTPKHTVALA